MVALLVLMIELHILCLKNKGRPRAAVEALDQIIEKRQRQLSRKEKILGKLEKAEAADFKIVAQACCSSQINVARDHIPASFLFSLAGGDRAEKSFSLSTIC